MRQILKRILEHSADRGDQWRPPVGVLREAWSGLVGEKLAAVTRPAAIDWEEGRLTIETASEAWRRELQRHEGQLLARLREVLPWEIGDLAVRSGMIASSDRSPDETADREAAPPEIGREEETEPTEGRVEPPEDLEDSLQELDGPAADSARRILQHVRQTDD